jgi:uncharacterized protein YjbI with pentapeptide repeats
LRFASLDGAMLLRAKLVNANLTEARLSGANLRGADLTGATMSKTNVDGICFDDTTQWPKSFTPPSDPNGCER